MQKGNTVYFAESRGREKYWKSRITKIFIGKNAKKMLIEKVG